MWESSRGATDRLLDDNQMIKQILGAQRVVVKNSRSRGAGDACRCGATLAVDRKDLLAHAPAPRMLHPGCHSLLKREPLLLCYLPSPNLSVTPFTSNSCGNVPQDVVNEGPEGLNETQVRPIEI